MAVEHVLTKPTVADMVRFLQSLPQDHRLRIQDADTMWTITTIHVEVYDDAVFLSGKYPEMTGDDE